VTIIVSPAPRVDPSSTPLCPPAGALRGRRVGLRRDSFWLCWDYITDEWASMLKEDGADVTIWRAPVGKGDKAAALGSEGYDRFLTDIDIAVIGLCNCGSCSMWAVHDTVGALARMLPTVTVVTEQFEPLVRMLGRQRGYPELRIELLPYPLEGQQESFLRQLAREHYESLLQTVGAVR
jgi:hypothetical protein